jgi:hypothetical protein
MINAVRSKNAHKANLISAVTAVFTILSVTFPNTALAHLKEPLDLSRSRNGPEGEEGGCSRARRGRGGLRPEAPLLR